MTALTANQYAVATGLTQHRRALLDFAKRLYRNIDAAEDAVQQTFCRAFANLHRFDNEHGRAWLKRILFNEFRADLKKSKAALVSGADEADYVDQVGRPGDQDGFVDLMDTLHALDRLGPDGNALLHSALGSSLADLARDSGISIDVAKQRVFRGRQRLKTALGEAK